VEKLFWSNLGGRVELFWTNLGRGNYFEVIHVGFQFSGKSRFSRRSGKRETSMESQENMHLCYVTSSNICCTNKYFVFFS